MAKQAPKGRQAKKRNAPQVTRRPLRFFFKLLFTLLVVAGFALAYLDAWVMERFEGRKWHLPATVYARSLTLFEGQVFNAEDLVAELQAGGYVADASGRPGSYRLRGAFVDVHLRPFKFHDGRQPHREVQVRFRNGRVIHIREGGRSVTSVRLNPIVIGSIHPRLHEARQLVKIDDVPQSLIDALLTTEDREFYTHHGISPRSIARAFKTNLREGRVVQGGSTITQQLVKNFFLTNERSYTRKALEAVIAILLDARVDKHAILEAYINEVFVAQDGDRAIHGFGLASEFFFSMPLSDLQPHQTAMLVGIMKGPSYYHPIKYPKRTLERRNLVLSLMGDLGHLPADRVAYYQQQPLGVQQKQRGRQNYAAYLDLVREQLRREYSEQDLSTQGLRIFTHMNPHWQWRAQSQLTDGIKQLQRQHGSKAADVDGAVVVVDHGSGDVVALAGGKAAYSGAYNRALNAHRPIGSLVKPAVYLTAFENGYHLLSPISDAPLTLTVNGKDWRPDNFDHRSHTLADLTGKTADKQRGFDVPLYQALAKSYNIAAVRVGMDVGVPAVADTLGRLGFEGRVPRVPSLMLGAVDMTPLDVAQMYATIANRGFYAQLQTIYKVTDHDGQLLSRYPLAFEQRIALGPMHMLDYGLQSVMHEGTGRRAAKLFARNHRIAGKTGTSNDQRDSWFAGYDASKTAVVWLGTDDNQPLPFTGSSGALPVWASIMKMQHGISGPTPIPDEIAYHWVDQRTGELSREGCDGAIYLPFIHGQAPVEKGPCYNNNSIIHWFKKWFQ